MTTVLGINNSHNGSVALINDGEIIAAIQAERLSRVKKQPLRINEDSKLLRECVTYCLEASEKTNADIDALAICTPWMLEKISENQLLQFVGGVSKNYAGTFFVPHHFAHMEYIIHYGNLTPGIVLVIDGSGSLELDRGKFNIKEEDHHDVIKHVHFCGKEVISAYWFDGKNSSLIYRFSPSTAPKDAYNQASSFDGRSIHLQSVGHYWEWASQYCCGSVNSAGKVMGLTAFGRSPSSEKETVLAFKKDGTINVNYKLLKNKYKYPNIFGLDVSGNSHYENFAARVQSETEETIIAILKFLKTLYQTETLYYSGGVALNVVANEKIIQSGLFEDVILNGSVEDNGTAIGAALAASYVLRQSRTSSHVTDYYGQTYSESEILGALSNYNYPYQVMSQTMLYERVAELISEEKVIGWFQGRSEFGPRALGNRSILANPKSRKTKYLLDHLMKCRDRYRPYAPVVVEEEARNYFNITGISPVMMRNVEVLDQSLVAITHVDGHARVQTVRKEDNDKLYTLLQAVKNTTGYPILLNTSFNLPGEPIVETPADALSSFDRGALDHLCLNNVLVSRR